MAGLFPGRRFRLAGVL